jgi:hypothetical protein
MVEFRDQAAKSLYREKYRQEMAVNSGLLVQSVRGNKITVNNNVYKEWIKSGGTNEVLLGLSLSHNPAQRVSVIDENAQQYKAAWARHELMSQSIIRNKFYDRLKSVIEVEFTHYLTNIPEVDLCLSERPLVVNRFKQALDCMRLDECDNLYGLVLRLLCAARYSHTDAYFILNTVDQIKKKNPTADIKEAVAVVTVEYISRWVAGMMKVEASRL